MLVEQNQYKENGKIYFDLIIDELTLVDDKVNIRSNIPNSEMDNLLARIGLVNLFHKSLVPVVIDELKLLIYNDDKIKAYKYPDYILNNYKTGEELVISLDNLLFEDPPEGLIDRCTRPLWFYFLNNRLISSKRNDKDYNKEVKQISRKKFENHLGEKDCIQKYIECYNLADEFLIASDDFVSMLIVKQLNQPIFYFSTIIK